MTDLHHGLTDRQIDIFSVVFHWINIVRNIKKRILQEKILQDALLVCKDRNKRNERNIKELFKNDRLLFFEVIFI